MASPKKVVPRMTLEEARAPSTRDLLIERVRKGELTPREAEAEATRLDLGALARRPDPQHFDPMAEKWWSFLMAIAWIVWRTPDAVREQWEAYRIDAWCWVPTTWTQDPDSTVYEGFDLHRCPIGSWAYLSMNDDYPKQRSKAFPYRPRSPHDAKEELWAALSEGQIEAQAIDCESEETRTVPTEDWKSLEVVPDIIGDRFRKNAWSRAGYHDVHIRRDAILEAWPPRTLSIERLPPPASPSGSGYMPLFCAVHWIATAGGTVDIASSETPRWGAAYGELLDRIASQEVSVTGIGKGRSQRIDSALFAGIKVRHLFNDEELSDADSAELYLFSYPYIDDTHWREGFDDSLRTRWARVWTRLMVHKPEVAKFWPGTVAKPIRGQGRPSDMELVVAEFRRRCGSGEALPILSAEAWALSEWLERTQTDAVLTAPTTIENNIRSEHRAYRMAHEKK